MGKLEGKIALVTGGNSGIGLASAKRFVDEGAYVFITGRRDRELAAAVKEIGRNVTGVHGDVANLGDLDRLFAQIKREKGRLPAEWSVYSATKAAVRSFARSWATDLKDRRIRVNAVSAGFTATPGLNGLLDASGEGDELRKAMSSTVLLGRFGTPDEIAKAVVFLASDDSSYVTGAELFVDGGVAQV